MKALVFAADGDTRRCVEELFNSRGLEVSLYADSAGARRAVERQAFAYVLLDLMVDGEEALELCCAIRDQPESADAYVLVLPPEETPEYLRAAFEAGADDYLLKPVDVAALKLRLVIGERTLAARQKRREAERRAEVAEQRYRTLTATMDEGLFHVDAEGLIRFANSSLSEITGFSLNELLGESADELLVEPEVRERLPGQTLLGTGTGSEEYSIALKSKSGEAVWVSLTAAPAPDPDHGDEGCLGVVRNLTEQRRAEEALRHREEYFRVLWENSSDLITILDIEGRILYQSSSSQRLLGWSSEELVGRNFVELLHDDDRDGFLAAFNEALEAAGSGARVPLKYRFRHGVEDWRMLEASCNNLIENPVVGGIIITARDVTERHRIEAALERERTLFQQLFHNSPAAIVILDHNERVLDANRAFAELFGYPLNELHGELLNALIVPDSRRVESVELSQTVFRKHTVERETVRRRRDGSEVEVAVVGYPVELADHQIGAFALYSDITVRKQAERKLFHEALHDALTGLPNRVQIHERLERALRHARRHHDYLFAVLFIDLDRFKEINDTLGHAAGDAFLVEIAGRLGKCLRPGDVTARLGGDEFVLLLDDLKHPADVTPVAERILAALARPFQLEGQEVRSSGSIGIAFGSPEYERAQDLLADADAAMYRAKQGGKARYEIFDSDKHKTSVKRLRLESELRQAIDQDRLEIHYQPIFALGSGRITSFEALLRWPHPERGLLLPADLLPLAEEGGHQVALGRWVMRAACRQLAAWQRQHPASDCLVLGINVSVVELAETEFAAEARRAVETVGIHPSCVGFEFTEAVMLEADSALAEVLWALRKLGFRLVLDAVGTGYSSLSALHRLPIDSLKIDRAFVQRMSPGGENLEIVRTLITLGDSLGVQTIAVGVESREQEELLRKAGASNAQGFLYAKPLAAEEAGELIAAEEGGRA